MQDTITTWRDSFESLGDNPQKEDLVSWLRELPNEVERPFEEALTLLVSTVPATGEVLFEILSDPEQELDIRYAAFFGLCTRYRRYRDVSAFHGLVLRYESDFGDRGTFNHLHAMALKAKGRRGDLQDAIERADVAAEQLPEHAGILHSYAEILIQALEEGIELEGVEELLTKAQSRLEAAIRTEPEYAKFFSTKGRFAVYQRNFDAARKLFQTAIDKEDSTRADYLLRVSDYQDHLVRVQLQQASQDLGEELSTSVGKLRGELESSLKRLDDHVDQFETTLQESSNRHLEFLGFFTAVVALTIGSIQLAQRESVVEAAQVLLVLAGALVAAFGGLGILIGGEQRVWRASTLVVLGLALCLGALFGIPLVMS